MSCCAKSCAATGARTVLAGAAVYLPDRVLNPGTVVIDGARIAEVHDGVLADPRDGSAYCDLSGLLLSAGFIDIHVHGMMKIDAMTVGPEGFHRMSLEAAKRGITALAPTTVACSAEGLRHVMESIHAARAAGEPGARLLGMHLESNFISMEFKGAQPPDQIFNWEDERAPAIREILDAYTGDLLKLTVAPEIPGGLDIVRWLVERGIIVSLGHSGANYDQAMAGFDAGATHATHLFNAMPPLVHRNPGLVGAALSRRDVFTEMVCDGIHIHPAVIAVAIAAKGIDRFIPVSDGLQVAGMTSGDFYLGGQHVTVQDNVARLDSGTIAGSITTMDHIAKLLVERAGCTMAQALYMNATTPADAINRPDLGRIAPGALADLVAMTPEYEVQLTLVDGKVVYRR